MSDLKALSAPFNPALVSWRVGSTTKDKSRGMALAYIDARDVMERLDEVCGPEGWQCRYSHATGTTVCEIGILCGDTWVWKADGSGDTDVEAEKGALSGAFKRAAVRWGIGRYLYHLNTPWVALEAAGNSWKITDSELVRLMNTLPRPTGMGSPANSNPHVDEHIAAMRAKFKEMRARIWECKSVPLLADLYVEFTEQLAEIKAFNAQAHSDLIAEFHKRGLKEAA